MVMSERHQRLTIPQFTDEQKDGLRKQGALILPPLHRLSINDLMNIGGHVRVSGQLDDSVTAITSLNSDVAIFPEEIFLPGSAGKTEEEQLAMIEEYSRSSVDNKFLGVKAIMGNVSDYAQVGRSYWESTGKFLYRDRSGKQLFARARTMPNQTKSTAVSDLDRDTAIWVESCHSEDKGLRLLAAVLLIPNI